MTAPAVFEFTAPSSPRRHREAAAIFMGKDREHELDGVSDADIGKVLGEEIRKFLDKVEVPRGLSVIGYTSTDIPDVSGTSSVREQALIPACRRCHPPEACA